MTARNEIGAGSAQTSYTPALGHKALTPLYDGAIALATRERVWRDLLIGAIALKVGERLLDVGCGTGSLLMVWRERRRALCLSGLIPIQKCWRAQSVAPGRELLSSKVFWTRRLFPHTRRSTLSQVRWCFTRRR